ncbi:M14 family zinc carboxypeptidase [Luteitalea sp.]|uniref:M14 family zinc carboxypeptidase n=1 Tax=Luteitalea sp. TaxID=2004800 RepID=UPI0025C52373|nr:M14 family zinc carboxypeptidase [Luteitalea sp.]
MRRVSLALAALLVATVPVVSAQPPAAAATAADLAFIDTGIENASPLWYERGEDGAYLVHLLYDHERNAPNRAAGHIHFRLVGRAGARLTLEFVNLDNVWNGRPGSVAPELKTIATSADGELWTTVPTVALPGNRVRVTLTMPGDTLYVARMQPYQLSDLDRLVTKARGSAHAEVTTIGTTVQGRPLEIVRIGREDAPHRVFLRARAHPWESGSSWVMQGLVDRLLRDDAEAARWRAAFTVYVLPMANKDGVARGGTRFNVNGKDLNRNWDRPADPVLVPENAALERWLEALIARGRRPDLAIELHNDGRGLLHLSRPPVPGLTEHLARMARFEAILRARTWFTEGHTEGDFRNSGTLGDGWLERYGIDALVHELNANWVEGRKAYTSATLWQEYGASLPAVFEEYLRTTRR